MRVLVISLILIAAVLTAGYLGYAEQIASGFAVLTVTFGALAILGSLMGGVRVSGRRRPSLRLVPKVRRSAA
ncbi:MAG: hypothetical protein ACK4MQ_09735 [Hyphomonas sp.]